jgi:hypothetical protein
MSLLVNNVVNASSSISYSYLESKEAFGYLLTLNYTIKTEDISFDNNDGVLLSGRAAIRAAYKRQNITARIAGDEILNGVIKSMSFSESSLTGQDTVQITIEERRRLNSYTSKTFAKYIPSPHLLTEFSDNYTFERSGSSYSYSRNISIKYAQDAGDEFLNNAKVFLTNYYFENRPQIGYYEDGISENARFSQGYNGTLNETIDLVNLSVSLQESFDSSFIDDTQKVSKEFKESLSVDQGGYLNKQISITFTSLRLDNSNVLEAAIASTIDDVFANEQSQFGSPHSIQKGLTKDSRKAEVTISFSTNPRLSQDNSVTYTCQKSKQESFLEYSLNVQYKSRGKNSKERHDNVISLWNSLKDQNESKVSGLFSEATSIYEKSRSAQINPQMGSVQETIVFSSNDDYDSAGLPNGIIKYKIVVNKQDKVKRNAVVLDLVNLKEKLVTSNLDSLGSATVTATVVSDPSSGINHGKNFLNLKTSDMNAALEEAAYYATSDQVQINLANGVTTRVINYIIA